jgi:hypothetical protein
VHRQASRPANNQFRRAAVDQVRLGIRGVDVIFKASTAASPWYARRAANTVIEITGLAFGLSKRRARAVAIDKAGLIRETAAASRLCLFFGK